MPCAALWNVSAPQSVHPNTRPPTAYLPAPHAPHTPSDTPSQPEAQNCPPRHVRQLVQLPWPGSDWYLPVSQGWHAVPPSAFW